MSLRDFNSNDDRPISLQNQPLGNGGGLQSFHTVQPEDRDSGVSNTPKIVGAVAVALMIGVAGIALYAHSSSSMQPKQVVAADNLPSPTPPAAVPAAQPAPSAPDANMPATTPATNTHNMPAPAPVRSASVPRSHVASSRSERSAASPRMAADTNSSSAQPQQQQQAAQQTVTPQQQAAIPEPVSPTAPPSSVATTNTQSGVGVPQGATTASDIPSNAAPAPAQDQRTTATPAPAQPPAQSAGQVNQ